MPCPTSKAVTHICPGGGEAGALSSKGNQPAKPSQRSGQPRGASSQTVPINARENIHQDGTGAVHTDAGNSLKRRNTAASIATHPCATPSRPSDNGAGSTLPNKDSGVTMKDT